MGDPAQQRVQDQARDPQPTNAQPIAPEPGAGLRKLQYLMSQSGGQPPPETVAFLVQQNPADRDAMLRVLQQTYGNAYTQQVIVAAQTPAAPSDAVMGTSAVAPGTAFKSTPVPKVEAKDPGAKQSSDLALDENPDDFVHGDPKQGVLPPPPAWVYGDGDPRDGAQRRQTTSPGPVIGPDKGITADGQRSTLTVDSQKQAGSLGSLDTTTGGVKTIDIHDPPPDVLDKYKKAADAALDEQIKQLDRRAWIYGGKAPADASQDPQQAHDDLVAAKAKLAEAKTTNEIDAIVQANKLAVAPPQNQTFAASVTQSKGTSWGGLADGSAVYQDSTKTAVQSRRDDGSTVTNTTDRTREVSTKGVNVANGQSRTTVGADGTTQQTSSKTSLTGGITDPLKLGTTSTTAQGGTVTTKSGAVQVGDGFGGVTGGVAKTDDKTGAGSSASGKLGMVSDDKGLGAKASLDDARIDAGNKQVSAGVFASADGTFQMIVTPTDDGGCTIALTAVVRGKLGAFAGKRDPAEPVTQGGTWNAGGGIYGEGSRTVTRSRKLSADEAKQILGNLDSLATSNTGGKRTFGADAAAHAYSAVFGGRLGDLADTADGNASAPGETASKIDEKGGGFDLKAGGSQGDSANARQGVGVGGSYESVTIDGHKETMTATDTTRSIVFGGRTGFGVDGSVSEGAAGMTGGYNQSNQATRTYVFTVPNNQPDLLKQVRALKTEAETKAFADSHKDIFRGIVEGNVDTNGSKVGASVGPLAVNGGTASIESGDVAKGQHTVLGPDGKPKIVKDLSGTEDGTRKDDASASLLGVKLAQGNTTVTSHGVVDPDGQSALDVTQTDSDSHASLDNTKKNMKEMGKADAAVTVATGGPMGLVRKLAERVGEQNTVGAHLDDAAFNQLVGVAGGDQKRWNDSILVDYRSEWFHLRNELVNPQPPADWLAQDDSPDHVAAKQLARMKSIAHFIAVAGPAGQQAIAHARGEYTADAIGQTVSWPPSLQDQKPVFDDLAKQVEHLRGTLLQFAQAGDAEGGKALLAKLQTSLGTLRQKIQDAPDHSDPTLGVRAANGIGDMQQRVAAWGGKFDAAIAAAKAKGNIEAALDGQKEATSTQLWHAQEDQKKVVAQTKEKTAALTAPADNASDAEWRAYNKQLAPAVKDEYDAEQKLAQQHDAETKARADEAKAKADASIPDYEQRCLGSKGKAFALLDQAVGALPKHFYDSDTATFDKLMQLGTLMHEWQQEWSALHGYYKDAGRPEGTRDDLRPGLIAARFDTIKANDEVSDNTKGYAGELKNAWGRI